MATLQLGIGNLPNAVALHLAQRNDLGIHSELFSHAFADLVKSGVANGKKKASIPESMCLPLHWATRRCATSLVNLRGKWTRERALALISIAHPSFRDELTKHAKSINLI